MSNNSKSDNETAPMASERIGIREEECNRKADSEARQSRSVVRSGPVPYEPAIRPYVERK
ncbi:hypothetical protein EVC45_10195 [Paraburkholderia sp. UYCP14C]|uniref:hypothetical protein n=1 Tax=Paraburkholderia sp. UYCP14C TaxID=2511130 RepID=UPI00102115BD|nr:hypothetical protein [Paraburkholderia sp. UYCP14C]RZF29959.1 hypothetical protein EVC45_10195 [Paraburkholderia sp. UYCP14C]